MSEKRRILTTYALPYANGHLHLGHLLGSIQADIYHRFERQSGHESYFVCGTDTHGTPIMLKAKQQGITPEELIAKTAQSHLKDFIAFGVEFDSYHSTHHPLNQQLVNDIYKSLQEAGTISSSTINQAYDQQEGVFLPDRFVKGTCPKCKAPDQHGDSCEACGSTYNPTDMIEPVSVLSGETPIQKETEHFFFDLNRFGDALDEWGQSGHLQSQMHNKLKEWFEQGLKRWDISRDAPYFGFEIPDQPGKYFYVWLDAPIGYLASFKKLCREHTELVFEDFWQSDDTELYHFVGKDIIYFHALFWPAVLLASKHRMPSGVYAHGFLTLNGEKMSKSRGTFVSAKHYLKHLDAECLRYYFACKLNENISDIDFSTEDFSVRINSDLVGKFVNIGSRSQGFLHKHYEGQLADALPDPELYAQWKSAGTSIAEHYQNRRFSRAMREIMALADQVNQYVDQHQPWKRIKDPELARTVQGICTQALNGFRLLACYLKPVLPKMADKIEHFLNITPLTWACLEHPLLGQTINPFTPLIARISAEQIDALLEGGHLSTH